MEHQDVPEEAAIADAVEQDRDAVELTPDEYASDSTPTGVPLEASEADWQEQNQTVDFDPYIEDADRES